MKPVVIIVAERSYPSNFVVCLRWVPSEDGLLGKARARRGTYAGELILDIYAGLFRQSLELKRDYGEFFSLEYASFAEYLGKRFLWKSDLVNEIAKHFDSSRVMIYFEPRQLFLDDDYGHSFLSKLLDAEEADED